jgi:iron(III) transport system substrate-binding protein
MRMITTVLLLALALPSFSVHADELTIYSTRKEQLLEPLIKAYQQKTGHTIKVVYDTEGPLLEKLKQEGAQTPADVLLVVDAGNLWKAADLGLLLPVKSKTLEKNVPTSLRDPQGQWFALTRRVRAIVYNPAKVKESELSTYEDLADAKWKGKLCLRSSTKVYNQSLVAMMIERLGPDATKKVVDGWVKNLAVKVFSDDTSLIKALENGPCHVGIVNSYYLGNLIKTNPEFPVKIFWPNQKTSGAHVNISGAGLIKTTKKQKLAQNFLEWSVQEEAQKILSDINLEFPVQETLVKELNPILNKFGKFKADTLNLSTAGKRQQEAVILMDSAGYQ